MSCRCQAAMRCVTSPSTRRSSPPRTNRRDPTSRPWSASDSPTRWRCGGVMPYADVDLDGLEPTRARLSELRVAAIEQLNEARLSLGVFTPLIADLERLTLEHPVREGLWSQLMRALYGAGRQSDALRAYQRLRAVLARELGIEPSGELRQLEQRILAQDPELAPPSRPDDDLDLEGAHRRVMTVIAVDLDDAVGDDPEDRARSMKAAHEQIRDVVRRRERHHRERDGFAPADRVRCTGSRGRRRSSSAPRQSHRHPTADGEGIAGHRLGARPAGPGTGRPHRRQRGRDRLLRARHGAPRHGAGRSLDDSGAFATDRGSAVRRPRARADHRRRAARPDAQRSWSTSHLRARRARRRQDATRPRAATTLTRRGEVVARSLFRRDAAVGSTRSPHPCARRVAGVGQPSPSGARVSTTLLGTLLADAGRTRMAPSPARPRSRTRRAIDGGTIRDRGRVGDLSRRDGTTRSDRHRARRRAPCRSGVRHVAHGLLHAAARSPAARPVDSAARAPGPRVPMGRYRQPHADPARARRGRDRCVARPPARRRPGDRSATRCSSGHDRPATRCTRSSSHACFANRVGADRSRTRPAR